MFGNAVYHDKGAVAVRYPRGSASQFDTSYKYTKKDFDIFGNSEADICIVSYGREFINCYNALSELENCFAIKLNKIKPLNSEIAEYLKNTKKIYFFEEGIKSGGVGEAFALLLTENNIYAEYKHIAVNDEFVKQASVERQFIMYGLDKESIIKEVLNGEENQA